MPDSLSWIGAVSLTQGATDGTVSSIAVQDNRLYAATIRKGIQVVDLDMVISEWLGALTSVINYSINTAGQGFATDAVIATIPVQSDPTLEYLDDLMDIKVANYPAAGGQNQTLVVATGSVPSAPGSATGVSFVVADPNAVTIVSKTTPQLGAGSLARGVALALGPIQTATVVKNVAAVVGYGSATGCASCTVLAVMDMTTPGTAAASVLHCAEWHSDRGGVERQYGDCRIWFRRVGPVRPHEPWQPPIPRHDRERRRQPVHLQGHALLHRRCSGSSQQRPGWCTCRLAQPDACCAYG